MRRIYDAHAYSDGPIGSYWEAVTPAVPEDPPLSADARCDVAIIGAGYTGLSAALHLARDFGCAPLVLDAQPVGWGASGRNGGFNCLGGSKLSDQDYARRYGQEDLIRFCRAMVEATDLVGALGEGHDIGRQIGGEWALAHRQRAFDGFADHAAFFAKHTGRQSEIVPAGALQERGLSVHGAHGAMCVDAGFPLNPRAYVGALADQVREAGGRIRINAPVHGLEREADGRLRVSTGSGEVLADRVILACNGYNSEDVPPWMAGRYLPVISHIMVTEPLPVGTWDGCQMAYDTRRMLHYFRRLPDGRMLFGMRGAANDGVAARDRMKADVARDFAWLFPNWADARIDYHWAGLVCMSRTLVPHVGPIPGLPGAVTSLAYHGNGVSMGTYCGRHAAGLVMGRPYAGLPDAFQAPLKRFPFAAARRNLLPLAFHWYKFRDGGGRNS